MKSVLYALILIVSLSLQSQTIMKDSLPYAEIPDAPKQYTSGAVVARMIDGLGFRYYWATASLSDKDLDYAPGNEGRTIRQTLEHIYGLSAIIINSAKKVATDRTLKNPKLSMEEMRKASLKNFKTASMLFLETKDLGAHGTIFKSATAESEFPFWNTINGPIEDAIWHAGQIVVLRRSAGNPIHPKVNVFLGKLND